MPSRRSGHKNAVIDVVMAVYVSKIFVLWHVVARIASANRRFVPSLVGYSYSQMMLVVMTTFSEKEMLALSPTC